MQWVSPNRFISQSHDTANCSPGKACAWPFQGECEHSEGIVSHPLFLPLHTPIHWYSSGHRWSEIVIRNDRWLFSPFKANLGSWILEEMNTERKVYNKFMWCLWTLCSTECNHPSFFWVPTSPDTHTQIHKGSFFQGMAFISGIYGLPLWLSW